MWQFPPNRYPRTGVGVCGYIPMGFQPFQLRFPGPGDNLYGRQPLLLPSWRNFRAVPSSTLMILQQPRYNTSGQLIIGQVVDPKSSSSVEKKSHPCVAELPPPPQPPPPPPPPPPPVPTRKRAAVPAKRPHHDEQMHKFIEIADALQPDISQLSGSTFHHVVNGENKYLIFKNIELNDEQDLCFLNLSRLCSDNRPPGIEDEFDTLSEEIYQRGLGDSGRRIEKSRLKVCMIGRMQELLSTFWPTARVYIVGSTMSGFSNFESDLDMVVFMPEIPGVTLKLERILNLGFINKLKFSDIVKRKLIESRIPLLKLIVSTGDDGVLKLDITCNCDVSVRNTYLMHQYCRADWRVRHLAIVIKAWAHSYGVNDALKQTPSSYSWTLLLIHYLQCVVYPPVVPVLMMDFPDKFRPYTTLSEINFQDSWEIPASQNNASLRTLLIGFFQYYSEFDFINNVIYVSEGQTFHKRAIPYNESFNYSFMSLSEPFTKLNTTSYMRSKQNYERVIMLMSDAYFSLKSNPVLSEIFAPVNVEPPDNVEAPDTVVAPDNEEAPDNVEALNTIVAPDNAEAPHKE